MPTQQPCPVPDIDRALSSYINTREETLKIRRTLSKYLTASLRPVNPATQSQHLNHECPHGCSTTNASPPGLQNARAAYLDALRARQTAQARHTELQKSLEELQNRHVLEAPTEFDSQYENEATQSYISLLRQRRRFAELQVISDSLEKLLDANPCAGLREPKTLVKDALGEQPDLPAERLEKVSQTQDHDSSMFKLKKDILQARSSMDRANSTRAEAQSNSQGKSTLKEQVYALSQAREEMVTWVQEELSKMEDESEFFEDASPVKRATEGGTNLDLASSETHIRGFYNNYTASRSAAIGSHDSIQQISSTNGAGSNQRHDHNDATIQPQDQRCPPKSVAKMLPHLPGLVVNDANERSLLQQAVYLQNQILLVDEEVAESIARLSAESHLLPSGSTSIATWGQAATDSITSTGNFTRKQLLDSQHEVNCVTTVMDLYSLQSRVLSSV